ncbi:MAG: prolyl oligopeptidase family serine peptidase [Spirochaetes bacterium]|nr:prolyl oligopeptidase family serine peptidase [Spirochaetota bacterium]
MIDIINAGKFLFQQQSSIFLPGNSDEEILYEKEFEFMRFYPKERYRNKPSGRNVILAVHGMSPYGNKDQRFINVCKSLAGCGYTVISPKYPLIQDLKIDPVSIDNIASSIEYITGRPDICPEARLSIFTVSFSGSLCLMAACRENTADKVKSICTIGAFHDIENIITYLLENPESDSYGRLIVLRNFLKYAVDVSAELDTALNIAIQDNFYNYDPPRLRSFLKNISPKDRTTLSRLMNDTDYRTYLWKIIVNNKDILNKKEQLTVDTHIDKLKASMLIIHGTGDNVIPYQESVQLHNILQAEGKSSRLILTPLLGHSNLKVDLNILPAVIDLFKGLSYFFKAA